MFSKRKFDKMSSIYKTCDNIDDFTIRITLKRLFSLIKIPQYNPGSVDNDQTDDVEIVTLKWQEKKFSRQEIELYGSKENCKNDTQKHYHELIQREINAGDGKKSKLRIFSYVADDYYEPEDEIIELFLDPLDKDDKCSFFSTFFGRKTLNISARNKVERLERFENMFIMADLNPEVLLFIIKWNKADRQLIIYPNFNDIEINPYFMEVDPDSRHMFHYSIENLSKYQKSGWKIKDLEAAVKMLSLSTEQMNMFSMPPTNFQILLLLEITSAWGFEFDNIHVRYSINKSSNYDIQDGNRKGCSHSSQHKDHLWVFGHCHEFVLNLNNTSTDLKFPINIDFEVISIDNWQRERLEGCARATIANEPGCELITLSCYRHYIGSKLFDKIERFFIGGIRKFDTESFNGNSTNNNASDHKLNRYSAKTISTGCLKIKIQIIKQCKLNLIQKSLSNLTQKISATDGQYKDINDVIASYQQARQRLQTAITDR